MNSISKKLTLYFTLLLLIFSAIIGMIFISIFREHTISLYKKDFEKRAVNISQTLSTYLENTSHGSGRQGGGSGAYINFLDDIAMSDVWLVDKDLSLITRGNGKNTLTYSELPEDGEKVILEALSGEISFSESFSNVIGEPSITVGAPVKNSSGEIVAVVLLHAPVEGIDSAVKDGFGIFAISITVALFVSIGASMLLSLHFTKPIKRIEASAKKLADGDYSVKTEISQNDEIGALAKTIDILTAKLDEASKESQQLDKLRRDFISNISHELRTPVTVIRGSLEAICDGVVTDSVQKDGYHKQMLSESIYLQRLVNDLLDLSKLQNTDFKMETELLNLQNVVEDAVHSIRHIANKKNIAVIFNSNVTEFPLNGDYGRLRQMFIIVLDNAVKFSKPNNSVKVDISSNEKQCVVSISNNGIGISEEDILHIFDRFHKINSEDNKTGTGLGLAIAKEIADKHNVKISVSSKINADTIFQFSFFPIY